MNRGKISFGKIGLSLGNVRSDKTPNDGSVSKGFGSFGKNQEETCEGKSVTFTLPINSIVLW